MENAKAYKNFQATTLNEKHLIMSPTTGNVDPIKKEEEEKKESPAKESASQSIWGNFINFRDESIYEK